MKQVKFVLPVGLFLLSLILITCDTKNNVEPTFKNYFIRYYGGDGNHEAKDFVLNSDGSILILAKERIGINDRIYLVKVDAEGNQLWAKTLGSNSESPLDIEKVTGQDQFYILSNFINSTGFTQIKVLKIDSNGDKLDSVIFNNGGVTNLDFIGNSITSLTDGGVIVTGNTRDTTMLPADSDPARIPIDQSDIVSLRFNSTLSIDPMWSKSFGGEPNVGGIKIIPDDDRFAFGGFSNADKPSPGINTFNIWLVRLLSNGDASGLEVFVGREDMNERLVDMARSTTGFMAIGTQTNLVDDISTSRVLAVSISSSFPTVFDTDVLLNEPSEGVAIATTSSSDYLILANTIGTSGVRDIRLLKVNSVFQNFLDISFGAPNNDDRGAAVAELPNGDILILGTMELAGQQDKIALIKVRADGTF